MLKKRAYNRKYRRRKGMKVRPMSQKEPKTGGAPWTATRRRKFKKTWADKKNGTPSVKELLTIEDDTRDTLTVVPTAEPTCRRTIWQRELHGDMSNKPARIPRETYLEKAKRLGLDLPGDRRLLFMSAFGFSNRAMRAQLGLSNGQISYRLAKWRKAGYKEANRNTFRDGLGPIARGAIQRIDAVAELEITRQIERNLPRFLVNK